MRLCCPDCGDSLLIKHKIELEILSEFDWKSDIVTLTNHFINKSRKTNALMPTKNIKDFQCRNCKKSCTKDKAHFKCDDCKRNFPQKDANAIGQSVLVCKKCLNENTSLTFFKAFGKRGPTKKAREDRVIRIMEEAGARIQQEGTGPTNYTWTDTGITFHTARTPTNTGTDNG
jgi:hypothetical protein